MERASDKSSLTIDPPHQWRFTRRVAVAALAGATLAPRSARADLFGGDIGVMLAQLEQQFQLVSNAIQTVKNLYDTVSRLTQVVANGEAVLKQAGSGGVDGILNTTLGLVNLGRGVVSNVRSIDTSLNALERQFDTWKAEIFGNDDVSGTPEEVEGKVRKWNLKTIKAADDAMGYYRYPLDSARDDQTEVQEVVRQSQNTTGVVGQLQLGLRVSAYTNKALWAASAAQAAGLNVLTTAAAKQSYEDEQRANNSKKFFDGWATPGTATPMTELPKP